MMVLQRQGIRILSRRNITDPIGQIERDDGSRKSLVVLHPIISLEDGLPFLVLDDDILRNPDLILAPLFPYSISLRLDIQEERLPRLENKAVLGVVVVVVPDLAAE